MDDLPIDIHSTKLLDWIISHRHCKKNWQDSIPPIRAKVAEAIKDMPENEQIVALLQASLLKGQFIQSLDISYFHCKEIIKILKETEKDTKNMFGYYSSQRIKDWQEILNLYERDSVYLAEAAQFLQRFVLYEIPGLRKQIAKAENGIKENEMKVEEYQKQSVSARKAFEKELEQLGIGADSNLRQSLLQLATDVPITLAEVRDKISSLQPAIDYYEAFRRYTAESLNSKTSEQCLPRLRNIQARHPQNITYYEWKYKIIPVVIEEFDAGRLDDIQPINAEDNKIDFDDGKIDFGDEPASATQFAIEIVDQTKNEGSTASADIARGNEALSILEHPKTYPIIVAELTELHSFLTFRRIDELTESASDIYLSGIENRPPGISAIKISDIEDWTSKTVDIKRILEDPRNVQLFKIRSSPIYVEEAVSQLEKKRLLERKYQRMTELAVGRQNELSEQIIRLRKLLEAVIESTKTLQENLELDISQRYKGRDVYIMGEINAVLYESQ